MDEPDERLDLVDANDNIIGTIDRQAILSLEETGQGFARAVGVFIMNEAGRLWIPRRSEHKKIAPGGLDFSTGEHVGHGESYEAAALRGLDEELHVEPDANKLTEVGIIPPFAGMPYFHRIYLYQDDDVPTYNKSDFVSFEWLTPHETATRLQAGEAAKEILLPSVQLILEREHREITTGVLS